jgi:hypothetical protein
MLGEYTTPNVNLIIVVVIYIECMLCSVVVHSFLFNFHSTATYTCRKHASITFFSFSHHFFLNDLSRSRISVKDADPAQSAVEESLLVTFNSSVELFSGSR